MTTRAELDALSAKELHDRALAYAERHLDVKFFFKLLELLPAASASAGDLDRSRADIFALRGLVQGIADADEGETAEALRPFYTDYLLSHEH